MNTKFTDKQTLLIKTEKIYPSQYVYLVKTSINFKAYREISSKMITVFQRSKLRETCLSHDINIFAACLLASVHTLKGLFTWREEDVQGRSQELEQLFVGQFTYRNLGRILVGVVTKWTMKQRWRATITKMQFGPFGSQTGDLSARKILAMLAGATLSM